MNESIEELNFDELRAECDLDDYAEPRVERIKEIADKKDLDLTAWESKFLASLVRQLVDGSALTDNQESKLDGIYKERTG